MLKNWKGPVLYLQLLWIQEFFFPIDDPHNVKLCIIYGLTVYAVYFNMFHSFFLCFPIFLPFNLLLSFFGSNKNLTSSF